MADQSRSEEIRRDARDLRRGVVVNLFGYVLKVANPAGVILIAALYGEALFGLFVAGEAALLLIMRICLLGLDKGILWWVARQSPENEREGIAPVLLVTGAVSTAVALALFSFAAPWVAGWRDEPNMATSLQWMSVALIPMTLAEVLIGACLGKRKMEAQVVIKEGMVPLLLIALALGIGAFESLRWLGLPVAFVIAQSVGLLGAIVAFRRAFVGSRWPTRLSFRLPPALVRYSVPMWGNEVANSFLQRIDTLILAALTNERTVGIWGVVMRIGNALRTIRRAFDPIVLSIVSQIGARKDLKRLEAGVSYATSLVMITQMPVYAFIVAFAPVILALMGHNFDEAVIPIIVLSAFWSVNGVIGLQGVVVVGYGRSDLAVVNSLVALAVQAGLLWVLIPGHGLVGAAWAVGIGTLVQNALAVVQSRLVTGGWTYDSRLSWLLVVMVLGAAVMAAVWWVVAPTHLLWARVLAFVGFLAVEGLSLLWLHRTHRLAWSPKAASA